MATRKSSASRAATNAPASGSQLQQLLAATMEELGRSAGAGSGARLKRGRVAVSLANVGSAEIEVEMDYGPEVAVESLGEWGLLENARPVGERVAEAKRLLAEGRVYRQGCSEFVCAVLGIPWRSANDLMGSPTQNLGAKPPYASLAPGDVAGWVIGGGSGHVAIYTGEPGDKMFIDVKEPGEKPRAKNGFWNHDLFKSTKF